MIATKQIVRRDDGMVIGDFSFDIDIDGAVITARVDQDGAVSLHQSGSFIARSSVSGLSLKQLEYLVDEMKRGLIELQKEVA